MSGQPVLPTGARYSGRVTTRTRERRRTDHNAWLLVTVATAGAPSSLRVYVWRHLRALGGVYLQQAVCILPDRPETLRAVNRLLDKVNREGGTAKALHIAILDADQQGELEDTFRAERADEYREIIAATDAFLAELETEQAKGRTTYSEVEESEAELDRLRIWLGRVNARDYHGATDADQATAAVEACRHALARFEADAFAAEAPPAPTQRRLRAVPTIGTDIAGGAS